MARKYSCRSRYILNYILCYKAWIGVCRMTILDWTVQFDINYNNHSRKLQHHVQNPLDSSWRRDQYCQKLGNLHILTHQFGSIFNTTIYCSGYSCTLFQADCNIEEQRRSSLRAAGSSSLGTQPLLEVLQASGIISETIYWYKVVQLWLPKRFTFC
jgi:hypothetical protein